MIKISGENSPYKTFQSENFDYYTKHFEYMFRVNLGVFIQLTT